MSYEPAKQILSGAKGEKSEMKVWGKKNQYQSITAG